MTAYVKVGGAWKDFAPSVKVGGTWKNVDAAYVKVGGVWKKVYAAVDVRYVVIAGGGGAVSLYYGGSGAGGYRSNVPGELSGRATSAEPAFTASTGVSYNITVGAGGAASSSLTDGSGGSSVFANISTVPGRRSRLNGGSGGGQDQGGSFAGQGTSGQGFPGGQALNQKNLAPGGPRNNYQFSGGGGGAGSVGGNGYNPIGATNVDANSPNEGVGGDGITSSITGTAIGRAGGGAAVFVYAPRSDGGGTHGSPSGIANSGGGGSWTGTGTGGNGGSGVVILSIPSNFYANFSAGVSYSTNVSGGRRIYTVTAAGTSDTVTFTE